MEKNLFPIGRVVKPHGIRGKIKVKYFGEDVKTFSCYRELIIEDSEGRRNPFELLEVTPQPPLLILRLKGIETVEDAQSLVGREILIPREALPDLDEGEYYWVDLLGMRVETEKGKSLGRIKEILATGAHDVYVIEGKRGEISLPAIIEVVKKVDRERGVVKVQRMEGLWEEEDEI
jgi:16S rRNA processing protein RimM